LLPDGRRRLANLTVSQRDRSRQQKTRRVSADRSAYALLEQSASPQVLAVLERCVRAEPDPTARELVAGVVARLRAEQS
jgi:hypothetical protein